MKKEHDFETKLHDVLVVYKQIEMHFNENGNIILQTDKPMVHTVSSDEKPEIQAISTTNEDLRPSQESGCVYRDYEYKRLGTIYLLAGIDLLTEISVPVVSDTHKSSDFIVLLEELDEKYPKKDIIRIIWQQNHENVLSSRLNMSRGLI